MEDTERFIEQSYCPLCATDASKLRLVTDRGTHFEREQTVFCPTCSLVFLNPRLSPKGLREYYQSDSFSEDFRGSAAPSDADNDFRDHRADRRWGYLAPYVPAGGSCLEIGCSNGSFLRLLDKDGRQAFGIDPSDGYARHAQSRGLSVVSGEFPHDMPADWGPFDTVAIFHVIEHVHDPLAVLRQIHAALKPGGKLLLEYPDVERASRRPRFGPEYFQRSHLHDFSEHTMTALMSRAGFEVEQGFFEQTPPLDKNVLFVATRGEAAASDVRRPPGEAEALFERLVDKISASDRNDAWRRLKRAPIKELRRWWNAA